MRTAANHQDSPARRARIPKRAGTLLAALLLAVAGARDGAAQDAAVEEYEVKAAFVYNFAKFATWPPAAFTGPDAPLVLCVAGGNPFGPALGALHHRPVGDRHLAVREIADAAFAAEDAVACHLLFIARAAVERWTAVAGALRGRPVLTIADSDGFTHRGGIINLYIADGRVRFEVNRDALARSGVTLSSQVLRLARIVEDAP